MLRRLARRFRAEVGQTTAEYALVILGAAAIGALLIAWATKSHAIGKLFDEVVVRDQVAVVHAAREAARAASVDPDSGRAVRAARRTLRGAEVDVGDRPAVGEPITVEVSYRSVTDLPLVGPLFPDPTLHSRVSMRVER